MIKITTKSLLIIAFLTQLSIFNFPNSAKSEDDNKILAEFDKEKFTFSDMKKNLYKLTDTDQYNKILEQWTTMDKEAKKNMIKSIIMTGILISEAEKDNISASTEYKKNIEAFSLQLKQKMLIDKMLSKEVTDKKLEVAYQKFKKEEAKKQQFKIRHILLKDEDTAKKAYAELKKGGDFVEIAKKYSDEKGVNTGEVDTVREGEMIKPFVDNIKKINPGNFSEAFKTDFGWHIIKLEAKEAVVPAEFEQVKNVLREELSKKSVEAYVESLAKQHKLIVLDIDGEKK